MYAETSDADSRSNPVSYTKLMESVSFIVSLVSAQHVLSISQPLSNAFQNTECDIVKHITMQLCRTTILKQRENMKFIAIVWDKATIIGGIEHTKPRTVSNSRSRSSAGCDRSGSTIDHGEPDGLGLQSLPRPASTSIDDIYVDISSLTNGMSSTNHNMDFLSATVDQNNNPNNNLEEDFMSCNYSPPFIGSHYFLEFVTASPTL